MSGKSKEEVAFELLAKLKGVGIWGENNIEAILDMYAKCLEATAGLRPVDGKAPTALRMAGQAPAVAAPAPAQAAPAPRPPATARPPAPPQQPQLRQAQPVAAQPAYQQQVPAAR